MSASLSRFGLGVSLASLAAFAAVAPAFAQAATDSAESGEPDDFGAIVVTAQKREQQLNDVGITIAAFGGKALDQLGVQDTTDIAAIVPGLTFTNVGFGPPIYNLRGVGFKDTSYNAASTVGVYVDEAAVAYPVMSLGSTLDLERVEVLKGPQGTLYGRNNTGGAINYIAAKPTAQLEGGIKASYGNYQRFDVEGFISGPISDTVRARLAMSTTRADKGWQRNVVTGERLGKIEKTAARLSVEADLGERTEALLQFGYWSDDSEVPAAQAVKPGYQSPGNAVIIAIEAPWIARYAAVGNSNKLAGFASGQDLRNNMDTKSLTARLKHEVTDDIEFTSITAYSEFRDRGGRRDIGGFAVPFNDATRFVSGYAAPQDFPWLPNLLLVNNAEINAFSQELRVSGDTGPFNWVLGGYYADDKVDSKVLQEVLLTTNTNNFGPLTNPADPASRRFNIRSALQDGVSKTRTLGVFAQGEYELTDELRVTAGLRYSDDTNKYVYCARDSDGLFGPQVFRVPAGACFTLLSNGTRGQFRGKLSENSLSGKLSLDYKLNPDTLLYAGYSRGFKAGSFPNQLATVFGQLNPAVQEELNSLEAGFKATLANGDVQFNGAAFYNFYKDKQVIGVVIDPQFGVLRRLVNIPKSEVRGFETEVQLRPVDGLFISLGGSYIDTVIKGDFVGPNAFAVQINYGGSRFTDTAKFQATGLFNYDFPVSDGLKGFLGGDFNYSSSINYDFQPGRAVPGVAATAPTTLDKDFIGKSYAVFGARIGLADEDDAWRVSLWARNIGDKTYTAGIRKVLDAVARYRGMARTYGVTAEFNF